MTSFNPRILTLAGSVLLGALISPLGAKEDEVAPLRKCDSYCATEHFHEVPADWERAFRRVIGNVTKRLGYYDIDIVAWPSSNKPPVVHGKRLQGGQYVSGGTDADGRERVLMVLEIPETERKEKHPHLLSVIAHEYFHVYQRHVNPSMHPDFTIKWVIEGSAAVFESMYLKDFENNPHYAQRAQLRHALPAVFGATMETYENPEINYGTSTAMVLFACRKAGFQRMVDYWKRQPTDEKWKALFEEVFEISVEEFYAEGKRASLKDMSLSAMGNLRRIRF